MPEILGAIFFGLLAIWAIGILWLMWLVTTKG